jgi:hypothetical protein
VVVVVVVVVEMVDAAETETETGDGCSGGGETGVWELLGSAWIMVGGWVCVGGVRLNGVGARLW